MTGSPAQQIGMVTTEQPVGINYIPEVNLYRLLIHYKLPSAERFELRAFDEGLPSSESVARYFEVLLDNMIGVHLRCEF